MNGARSTPGGWDQQTRVLVVDDSAFARKVLRSVLETDPRLEVVDIARDGLEALEKIAELRPDVVTLDLVMPHMDGVAVLRSLARDPERPEVVVVSISDADSALGVTALQTGAFDLVAKPTALATSRLMELSGELVAKVVAAGEARKRRAARGPETAAPAMPSVTASSHHRAELVVIGTSTGGPQALTRLLRGLPIDFPPVVVALHIPEGYTRAMAERLDQACAVEVREAEDGLRLTRGQVVIARGGKHLKIRRDDIGFSVVTSAAGKDDLHVPSVDQLFDSAAAVTEGRLLAVVLTGMGADGLEGSRAVSAKGGVILTESESSCVVYGMPRVVADAGLSSGQATVDRMVTLMGAYV